MTFASLLLAILLAIVTDEFFSWAPKLSSWLVKRNAARLPDVLRDRYLEEWAANLNDIPGRTTKLLFALDTWRASGRIAHENSLRHIPYAKALTLRFFDFIVSAACFLLQWPLFLFIAIAIFSENGGKGPVFYSQTRVGRFGRQFEILRFRTMRVDLANRRFDSESAISDARITIVGAFLRKTRLDEIPTLLNVFRGDMSIVGPQAELAKTVGNAQERITGFDRRHDVRPGLTGLAQLNVAIADVADYQLETHRQDIYFIENLSFSLVLRTIWRTFIIVMFGER